MPAPGTRLDRNSQAMVAALAQEVAREEEKRRGPWINTNSYGVPLLTVPADQPTVRVQLFMPILAVRRQSRRFESGGYATALRRRSRISSCTPPNAPDDITSTTSPSFASRAIVSAISSKLSI